MKNEEKLKIAMHILEKLKEFGLNEIDSSKVLSKAYCLNRINLKKV